MYTTQWVWRYTCKTTPPPRPQIFITSQSFLFPFAPLLLFCVYVCIVRVLNIRSTFLENFKHAVWYCYLWALCWIVALQDTILTGDWRTIQVGEEVNRSTRFPVGGAPKGMAGSRAGRVWGTDQWSRGAEAAQMTEGRGDSVWSWVSLDGTSPSPPSKELEGNNIFVLERDFSINTSWVEAVSRIISNVTYSQYKENSSPPPHLLAGQSQLYLHV